MRPEHWLFTIPLRLRSLFRWTQADQELDDELRDHLERKTEEYIAQGMRQEEAHRRARLDLEDRKSTRLNSSHGYISYAVFCLKKKKHTRARTDGPLSPRARYTARPGTHWPQRQDRHPQSLRSSTLNRRRQFSHRRAWSTGRTA